MSRNPFPRSILGAAFNMPRIELLHQVKRIANQPMRDLEHAILVLVLACRIHECSIKVRQAALQMYTQLPEGQREFMLLIVQSRDPIDAVERTLQDLEIMKPSQMANALLVIGEFRKVTALLGIADDQPLAMATTRVQALLHREAEAYAMEDQLDELQRMLDSADKGLANAQKALAEQCQPAEQASAYTILARLRAIWDADDCPRGAPDHGHRVPGHWDGDAFHPKGSICQECAAHDDARALLDGKAVTAPAAEPGGLREHIAQLADVGKKLPPEAHAIVQPPKRKRAVKAKVAPPEYVVPETARELGFRLQREGKTSTDLWAAAVAAGVEYRQVMAGYTDALTGDRS